MGHQTEANTDHPPIMIVDGLRDRLIELTGGAAEPCYQCGSCTAICPWGLVKDTPVSVRQLIHQAQIGLFPDRTDLWLCTTCGQCETYCPRGVDIAAVIRGLRQVAWENRSVPEGLPSLLWSVYWNDNPWTQPPSQRARWAADLNLEPFNPKDHEILLYIGCTASYDPRAGQIAHALVKVLKYAGVDFGYLGEAEPCCGEAVLSVGHQPYFEEIASQTMNFFQEHRVNTLVTISPHCYDVFRNHYPSNQKTFTPLHYTQFLSDLIGTGRLKIDRKTSFLATIQDPCYLARHNQETAALREVLGSVPGLILFEMENSRENTLCCGGGGGRMWLETEAGDRFSDLRIQEAMATGAEIVVTACPFCVACLDDSIKAGRIHGLEIMDVAELLALAIEKPISSHIKE